MPNKLFLIDGHALIFKTYYALLNRPMINSKGVNTSILYGFTKYLFEIIEKEAPTHLAVVFDPPGGSFRNKIYGEYKANRPPTPSLIIEALEPLTTICQAIGVPALTIMGYEADDVIGSIAKKFASTQNKIYMVTPDKDYGQLVDDNIFQFKPGKSGGEDTILGVKEVCEKYGINSTSQVVDLLTLCGDAADNVPGVEGVGEKTASKLLLKYGSVDNIYAHISELSVKQQEKFKIAKEHIQLSHNLVTIKTDIPIDIDLNTMEVKDITNPKAYELFDLYEFNSLKKHLKNVVSSTPKQENTLNTENIDIQSFNAKLINTNRIALAIEDIQNINIFTKVNNIYLALQDKDKCYTCYTTLNNAKPILENCNIEKVGYDLKKHINLLIYNNINIDGRLLDIALMHYIINPEQSSKINNLALSYLNINLDSFITTVPTSLFDTVQQVALDKEVATMLLLSHKIEKNLGELKLYWQMEEPLLFVLAKMERNGVMVDLKQLSSFAKQLYKELTDKELIIRQMCDEPNLNISSPKQIGVVLFEKLQIDPKAKKSSKGNWSTDEATLTSLAHLHPIVKEILEYRAIKKLLSTYIDPFPTYVNHITGRIHTTFNQALTSTGRLSSSNPNLQNIPIRTQRGKEIRKAFIAQEENGLILSADYSQIELRIMAHLSQDEHLIKAFKDEIDIHSVTAAKIFNIPYNQVTPEQRRIAKTANFGIMYGISAFGLSQRLDISVKDAKQIINDYFEAFPTIKSYIAKTIAEATINGYAKTIFGRKRYITELTSTNATVRALGERNAVNAPIQGSAADIIKLAMININKQINDKGLKSKMILQIHDELLFETSTTEADMLKKIVVKEMENVLTLLVPLTVECSYGKNWLEAH